MACQAALPTPPTPGRPRHAPTRFTGSLLDLGDSGQAVLQCLAAHRLQLADVVVGAAVAATHLGAELALADPLGEALAHGVAAVQAVPAGGILLAATRVPLARGADEAAVAAVGDVAAGAAGARALGDIAAGRALGSGRRELGGASAAAEGEQEQGAEQRHPHPRRRRRGASSAWPEGKEKGGGGEREKVQSRCSEGRESRAWCTHGWESPDSPEEERKAERRRRLRDEDQLRPCEVRRPAAPRH